jgi:hypothetical protein
VRHAVNASSSHKRAREARNTASQGLPQSTRWLVAVTALHHALCISVALQHPYATAIAGREHPCVCSGSTGPAHTEFSRSNRLSAIRAERQLSPCHPRHASESTSPAGMSPCNARRGCARNRCNRALPVHTHTNCHSCSRSETTAADPLALPHLCHPRVLCSSGA